ncbi:MAG: CBS domain-containing protein [Planctomycetota bacterium]|jgi:CBS domain-containing protein
MADAEEGLRQIEIMALELEDPVVLEATRSVRDVLAEMRERRSGYALLTEGDVLVGIFTERDVLTQVLGSDQVLDEPISRWMTRDTVCVRPDAAVREACFLMYREGFRHLPVLDDAGKILGCVRHRDIIRLLVSFFLEQVMNLPPDPDQVARAPEGG